MTATTTKPYRVRSWHLHWQFWRPIDCGVSKLRFGFYAACEQPGGEHIVRDTLATVTEKRRLGVIE